MRHRVKYVGTLSEGRVIVEGEEYTFKRNVPFEVSARAEKLLIPDKNYVGVKDKNKEVGDDD